MTQTKQQSTSSVLSLLKPYTGLIVALVVLTVLASGLNLLIPRLMSQGIDAFASHSFDAQTFVLKFALITGAIFVFTLLQSILQVYASERVARNLRAQFVEKLSHHTNAYVQRMTTEKLLTNLTSDIDAIKLFVSQAISSLIASVFLIIGSSALLIATNWKLALAVLAIVPFLGVTFKIIFGKVHKLFRRAQEAIDRLNKIINESILGAALIRIINAQASEYHKFLEANAAAKNISISILRLFASLIPIIGFFTNVALLVIVSVGGYFVISDTMTLGEFTAFQNYLSILIFPIMMLGFVSNLMASASASYGRIRAVLDTPIEKPKGTLPAHLRGNVVVDGVSIIHDAQTVVDAVSFAVPAGARVAIIGPTGAGKTQLLYALTGLIEPNAGTISYDGHHIDEYDPQSFHAQVGFVFQESILFNLSLRENIAFGSSVTEASLAKAIKAAELSDFVAALPDGLETIVSERGTTLSGGQKQRVMLARALALDPKILILDDFTARVDTNTEKKVLENVRLLYPDITLISVTQKIAPIEAYDQIIVLMDGAVIGAGKHQDLMHTLPEYVQIYQSQQSTEQYELQA